MIDPDMHERIMSYQQEHFQTGRFKRFYFYREMTSYGPVFMIESGNPNDRVETKNYDEAEERWIELRKHHAVEMALWALGIDD